MKRNTFTRLAALALTLILALSLTACGGKDNTSADNNDSDTKATVKIGVPIIVSLEICLERYLLSLLVL